MENIESITKDQIIKATFTREDEYYERVGGNWYMDLDLIIDGRSVEIRNNSDEYLMKKVESLVNSRDFIKLDRTPLQYGQRIYQHYEVLTTKIAKSIKPENILYAEYSADGAMGACGTARVYELEGNHVNYYLCSVYTDNGNELRGYYHIGTLLAKAAEDGIIDYCYGGYGNYAYKKKDLTFKRDDDNGIFIYRHIVEDGESIDPEQSGYFYLCSSVKGIYMHIVDKFADGEITGEMISAWEQNLDSDHLKTEEIALLHSFIDYYKEHKIETTLHDYINALCYIRHINYLDTHYDYEGWIDEWIDSLAKYRLRYLIDKYGENKIQSVFSKFVIDDSRPGDLFKLIQFALDENVAEIFAKYEVEKRDSFNIDAVDEIRYPIMIELPNAAHKAIIEKIANMGPAYLRAAYSLGYYLTIYLENLDKLELHTILPAAFHILRYMPKDDLNRSHTDYTYWAAAELVNKAWEIIDEPKTLEWFEKEVYDSCWAQIEDIWPLKHYGEFRFMDEFDGDKVNVAAESIFDEALGFILAIDNIKKYNPKLDQFLKGLTFSRNPQINRRIFSDSMKDKKPKEVIEAYYNHRDNDFRGDTGLAFYFPDTPEKTKILVDELLKDNNGIVKNIHFRRNVWLKLMSYPHKTGVGSYIVKTATQKYDSLHKDFGDNLPDLFYAACESPEVDMIKPLEKFREKLLDFPKVDKKALDGALTYAKKQVEITEFQRQKLRKA